MAIAAGCSTDKYLNMAKDVGQRGNTGAVFRNGTMDFGAAWLLGYAQQGGLSPGTLLSCFATIKDGDPRSWVSVFTKCAEEVEANACDASSWLAAQVAWRATLFLADPRKQEAQDATKRMERAFARSIETGGLALEKWSIQLGNATLPAWVSTNISNAPRAVMILGGGDTYVEDLWFFGGRALSELGWPVIMVDLPGQGNTPAQGLHFGKQTLDGLVATLDHLHAHGFAGDLVLLGWSGGGIFTTKYASIARPEDNLVALVASTPIHDAKAVFTEAFPAILRADSHPRLMRAMLAIAQRNRVMATAIAKYQWQFGPGGITELLRSLDDALVKTDVAAIDVPVLALVGLSEDAALRRQARQVVEAVRPRHPASRMVTFDAYSGGAAHCQVGNLPAALARVAAWLQDTLA